METEETTLGSGMYQEYFRQLQTFEPEDAMDDDINDMNSTGFLSDVPSWMPSIAPSWMPSIPPSPPPTPVLSSAPTQNAFIHSNDAKIIQETFRVYGSCYLVFFISFCIMRKKANKYVNIRSWVAELHNVRASTAEYGFFSWAWKVFSVSDDELLETCGMDALCFLRCLRLGMKFSLMGSLNSIWLVPLYVTAESSPVTDLLTDPFVKMSVANLPVGSVRFTGTIVATYITVLLSLYLITIEYDWYTKYRHKYLSQRKPRNYAIYVSGIPEEHRSSYGLADFFRQCTSWRGSVYEAHVSMDIPSLEAKVSKRNLLVEKMEHISALERKKGTIQTHHSIQLLRGKGMKRVDSIKAFTDELIELNSTIALEVGRITRSNHRMRQHLTKLPPSRTLTAVNTDESADVDKTEMEELSDPPAPWDTENVEPNVSSNGFPIRSLPYSRRGLRDSAISSRLEYISDMEEGSLPSECEQSTKSSALPPSLSDGSNSGEVIDEHTEELTYPSHPVSHSHDTEKGVSPPLSFSIADTGEDNLTAVAHDVCEGVFEDTSFEARPAGDLLDILAISSEEVRFTSPDSSREDPDHETGECSYATVTPNAVDARSSVSSTSRTSRTSKASLQPFKKLGSLINTDGTSSWALGDTIRSTSTSVSSSVRSGVKKVGATTFQVGGQVKKVSKVGVTTVMAAGSLAGSGMKLAAELGLSTIQQAPDLGKTVGASLVASAAAVVPLRFGRSEGDPREAGFVVFRDLYTTQAARQMLQHDVASCMLVEPAPDPDEIFWRNVGLPAQSKKTGWMLSMFATSVLCLFWSIPMAFFSSLTEVNSLKEKMPRLGELTEKYNSLESFFALIAPLLLLTMNEVILPSILRYFATWEGHVGASLLDASLFFKLCAFVIIQSFFVSALTGTITAELTNFLNNPEQIVDLLANSLPAQSSYFIQICLVFTFLLHGLDLIRAYPLGVAFLRRFCFGPNLTREERRKSWGWFSSLEDPPDFWHAELLAQIMLFFVVFFVYSVIAPITSPFLLVCFVLLESGYRYHFIHNQKPTPDSGGKLWPGFINVLIVSQLIGQCTLFGLLVLRRTVYALPALMPCGMATILFAIFVLPRRYHVANFLPTVLCAQVDKTFQQTGDNVKFFAAKAYLQPALKAEHLYPEGFEMPRARNRTMSIEGTG